MNVKLSSKLFTLEFFAVILCCAAFGILNGGLKGKKENAVYGSTKAAAEFMMLKNEMGGVYLGSGGYLIPKLYYKDKDNFDAAANQKCFKDNLLALSSFAQRSSYNLRMVLVPGPSTILKNRLPSLAPTLSDDEIYMTLSLRLGSFLDLHYPKGELVKHRGEYIYNKTDSRLTSLGAYYLYVSLGEVLNYAPKKLDEFTREEVAKNYYGNLAGQSGWYFGKGDVLSVFTYKETPAPKANINENITVPFYDYESLKTKDKYNFYIGGENGFLQIRSNNGNNRTLNIVKNSYTDVLIPFLALEFDSINIFDIDYYRHDKGMMFYMAGLDFTGKDFLILYDSNSLINDNKIYEIGYQS